MCRLVSGDYSFWKTCRPLVFRSANLNRFSRSPGFGSLCQLNTARACFSSVRRTENFDVPSGRERRRSDILQHSHSRSLAPLPPQCLTMCSNCVTVPTRTFLRGSRSDQFVEISVLTSELSMQSVHVQISSRYESMVTLNRSTTTKSNDNRCNNSNRRVCRYKKKEE